MKTSLYTVLCLVIRTLALYFLLGVALTLPGVLTSVQSVPEAKLAVLVYLVVCVLGAFVLWLYPGVIAKLASTRAAREPFESTVDAVALQRIAYTVVGASFALGALDRMLQAGWHIAAAYQLGGYGDVAPPWHEIVGPAMMFVAGIAVSLGSGGLARLTRAARHAGTSPVAVANDEA